MGAVACPRAGRRRAGDPSPPAPRGAGRDGSRDGTGAGGPGCARAAFRKARGSRDRGAGPRGGASSGSGTEPGKGRAGSPADLARRALPALLACAALAACEAPPPPAPPEGTAARIVSLDYCADQFVLGLADRDRILAVSPDARAEFSYLRAAAAGLPVVRPRAEDVLRLAPDLVVRSYGGGPNAGARFARAGVPVLQIAFAEDVDGVRAAIRHAARALGAARRGESLIAGMDARLGRARARGSGASVLYVTPSGVSAGPGTFIHHLIGAAALDNFQRQGGWRPIPLERLAYETPDLVATASFGARADRAGAWTPIRHPVARRRLRPLPSVALDGATTSCGGWFLAEAVETLAAFGGEPAAGARR